MYCIVARKKNKVQNCSLVSRVTSSPVERTKNKTDKKEAHIFESGVEFLKKKEEERKGREKEKRIR